MPKTKKTEPSVEELISSTAWDLGETHTASKWSETRLKELREEFFTLANLAISEFLAQESVAIPSWVDPSEASVREYVAHVYGDKELVEISEDLTEVVLIEKASSRPYSIAVEAPEDEVAEDAKGRTAPGFVVSRGIREKAAVIDTAALEKADPKLFQKVTSDPVIPDHVDEFIEWLGGQEIDVEGFEEAWLKDHPQPRLVSLDKVKPMDLAKVKKFFIYPPSSAVLNVRLAKADEV